MSSPLLRLPAKLRNKVYEYALGRLELLINCVYDIFDTGEFDARIYVMCRRPHGAWHYAYNILALTRVCRQ